MINNDFINYHINKLQTLSEAIEFTKNMALEIVFKLKNECMPKKEACGDRDCAKCQENLVAMELWNIYLLLKGFKYDQTFTRARYIWLYYQQMNIAPPKEVQEVFVGQLLRDIEGWEWVPPAKMPADVYYGLKLHDVFDKHLLSLKKVLKKEGLKGNKGDCYDRIALLLNNFTGQENETGDGIRKKIDRSRAEAGLYGFKWSALGSRVEVLLQAHLRSKS